MLSDEERAALKQWYAQEHIMEEAQRHLDRAEYEDLEELLHMRCLFPLSRHSELPDYMRDADGKPLFPKNLNPRQDEQRWQDAIEVGWEVVKVKLGVEHDDVHALIAEQQQQNWDAFMESVERRKRERGQK